MLDARADMVVMVVKVVVGSEGARYRCLFAVIILVGDCGGMGVVVAWWLQWHGGCSGMVVVVAW